VLKEFLQVFSRFDMVTDCDKRTDGQTSYDSVVRAVHIARQTQLTGTSCS